MPRRAKHHAPHPIDRHIGNRVRMQRLSRGWTQTRVADALGVSDRTYRSLEAAQLRLTPYRIAVLAQALGVEPGFFFVGAPTGYQPAPPLDPGSMENGDTRRLLQAWDRITGKPRKHLLALAVALGGPCS